jgi:site-specific DNA recombinase
MSRSESWQQGMAPKKLRCAIYTRVSSDAGLEQEFNSLDNQREAAEAHIRSQQFEGWHLVQKAYDDGGFSGGSIERPGLQALLGDVRAGLIDVIVVYKVDRLTRSLADFAKLVELFDAHGVSFVSVTQSFNTTTSMGRLTLNVLLSFAQFEREVTGERIRDKIAASKRKGIWMGGNVPYGYRVENRKLMVVPAEAADIRMIFERYLALASVPALVEELRAQGFVTRLRPFGSGKTIGGVPLTNGPLAVILKNRVYVGDITHKGQFFKGGHEAVIDRGVFEAVQMMLAENTLGTCERWRSSGAILIGRIYDDRGNRMTPAHANKYPGGMAGRKAKVRYRYYVSSALAQGRKHGAGSVPRVAAHQVEELVLRALAGIAASVSQSAAGFEPTIARSASNSLEPYARRPTDAALLIESYLDRIEVYDNSLKLTLKQDQQSETPPTIVTVPWTRQLQSRKREIILPPNDHTHTGTPIRAEARARLIAAIARARRWVTEIIDDFSTTPTTIASREGLSERSVRMTLPLAFLAPDLVKATVNGTLPFGAGITALAELPINWVEQTQLIANARQSNPRR